MTRFRLPLALALALVTAPALADAGAPSSSWGDVRHALYGERAIEETEGLVTLDVPYRAADDRRVPIRAGVAFADGRTVRSLTLIIDENPMPVSARFAMETPRTGFEAEVSMRLNGPSMVRAVVEASDGSLHMTSARVKTSGVGACAAAPVTGIEEALASLGEMDFRSENGRQTVDIRHPQHSGMQMDQITLLYILARYIDTVEAWGDDEKLFTMTGSISLSEDPGISFGPVQGVSDMRVRLTDTEGAIFERRFAVGGA